MPNSAPRATKPKELGGHMRNNLRALLAASVSLWVMTAAAQDESRPDESSKVGAVNFAVSCGLSAPAQLGRCDPRSKDRTRARLHRRHLHLLSRQRNVRPPRAGCRL